MKKSKNYFFQITLLILTQLLFSCAGLQEQQCPTGTQNLPGCPPDNDTLYVSFYNNNKHNLEFAMRI